MNKFLFFELNSTLVFLFSLSIPIVAKDIDSLIIVHWGHPSIGFGSHMLSVICQDTSKYFWFEDTSYYQRDNCIGNRIIYGHNRRPFFKEPTPKTKLHVIKNLQDMLKKENHYRISDNYAIDGFVTEAYIGKDSIICNNCTPWGKMGPSDTIFDLFFIKAMKLIDSVERPKGIDEYRKAFKLTKDSIENAPSKVHKYSYDSLLLSFVQKLYCDTAYFEFPGKVFKIVGKEVPSDETCESEYMAYLPISDSSFVSYNIDPITKTVGFFFNYYVLESQMTRIKAKLILNGYTECKPSVLSPDEIARKKYSHPVLSDLSRNVFITIESVKMPISPCLANIKNKNFYIMSLNMAR